MSRKEILIWLISTAALLGLALLPRWLTDEYYLSLMISILMYCVLATAWALFSGPTRYISLATVAFFGMGAYVTAVFGESLPWAAVLGIAAGVGLVMALIVGLSTLRLSGVYFVIFSFGLAELVKQLVTWWEVNITRIWAAMCLWRSPSSISTGSCWPCWPWCWRCVPSSTARAWAWPCV